MKTRTSEFLRDRHEIRRTLQTALRGATRLDIAVAFIGASWRDFLRNAPRSTRVVCWLSSTGTNPRAVRSMKDRNLRVRQIDGMHAKVYLTRGKATAAIVGSANLSSNALSDEDIVGQYETAVCLREKKSIDDVQDWFDALWKSASEITSADLRKAEANWEAARKADRGPRRTRRDAPEGLPIDWRAPARLRGLSDLVRDERMSVGIKERHRFFSELTPRRMTKDDLREVNAFVATWTGHPGAFRPALDEPLAKIRESFEFAFDEEGTDIVERLEQLQAGGRYKLAGYGINAWLLLLSWRKPDEHVPFNALTIKFLKSFGLDRFAGRSITANGYGRWRPVARDLKEALSLPSLWHVDAMAYRRA